MPILSQEDWVCNGGGIAGEETGGETKGDARHTAMAASATMIFGSSRSKLSETI
jgi:hypothetical protein